MGKVKGMQRPGTEAIRTQTQMNTVDCLTIATSLKAKPDTFMKCLFIAPLFHIRKRSLTQMVLNFYNKSSS